MSERAMYRGWTSTASVLSIGLLVLVVAANSDGNETQADPIVVLTADTFEETVKKHDRVLVNFYAHWHGACKKLAIEYEEVGRALKEKGFKTVMAKIDGETKDQGTYDLNKKHDIDMSVEPDWPYLWYYQQGRPKMQYKGKKKGAAILDWLTKREAPLITEISEGDAEGDAARYERFLQEGPEDEFAVLARVRHKSPRDKAYRHMVEDLLADGTNAKIRFATVELPYSKNQKTDATLTMWRPSFTDADPVEIRYTNEWIPREMVRWVRQGIYPTVGGDFSSQGIYGMAVREDVGIDASVVALLKDESPSLRTQMLELFTPLAPEYSQWRFTVANAKELNDEDLEALSATIESESMISVLQGKRRYHLEGQEVITKPDEVKAFLDNVKSKKIKAMYKSAPPPKKLVDKDGVTVLTGRTFEEHVLDPMKDVLVLFYAPWCQHCKNLAPEWASLGKRVKKEGWDDLGVVIAKIDGTENEHPEEANTYPLIMLYPAVKVEKKYKSRHKFEGKRQFERLFSFLHDNARNLKDVEVGEKKKKRRKGYSMAQRELERKKKAMDL